jgi:hypothetical protein
MSQANVEKFATYAKQNPNLLAQLTAGVQTPDEFIDRAVATANKSGYEMTRDEAKTWIDGQIAANKNGELSDTQLEAVAGGKGGGGGGNVGGNISIGTGGISIGGSIGGWFSGW